MDMKYLLPHGYNKGKTIPKDVDIVLDDVRNKYVPFGVNSAHEASSLTFSLTSVNGYIENRSLVEIIHDILVHNFSDKFSNGIGCTSPIIRIWTDDVIDNSAHSPYSSKHECSVMYTVVVRLEIQSYEACMKHIAYTFIPDRVHFVDNHYEIIKKEKETV